MHQLTVSTFRKLGRAITLAALMISVPQFASAYTSVATLDRHPDAVWVTSNAATADEADRQVLARCGVEAAKIRASVNDCLIFNRSSDKGWFATACGQAGCAVATGKKTLKAAQDAAFEICTNRQKFCSTEMPAFGEEVFGKGETAKAVK